MKFDMKGNIVLQKVIFSINNLTTNYSILLQNMTFYRKMMYYTTKKCIFITEVAFAK